MLGMRVGSYCGSRVMLGVWCWLCEGKMMLGVWRLVGVSVG